MPAHARSTRWWCVVALALTLVGLTEPEARACYWDRDTLATERARFPGVAELIAGAFARHSPEFYRWRAADRRRRLAADDVPADQRLAWTDDLAVALSKLEEHDAAIALLRGSLERDPDRYETHANLGTALIHAGELTDGLTHLRRAIEINPDAHFGREIVQQRLVEYVLEVRKRRPGLPLRDDDAGAAAMLLRDLDARVRQQLAPLDLWLPRALFETRGFAKFAEDHGLTREQALAGLTGMMKFGDPDSPVLLEALGDVLLWDHQVKRDGKRLAARAYLKAAANTPTPIARLWYRARAALTLVGHRNLTLTKVERSFADELRKGARLTARVAADEARWIANGEDPEDRFEKTYLRRR